MSHPHMLSALLLVLLAAFSGCTKRDDGAGLHRHGQIVIRSARVGFSRGDMDFARFGAWTPVSVELETGPGFQAGAGELRLIVENQDGDAVATRAAPVPLALAPGVRHRAQALIKYGGGPVRVTVEDALGRTLARYIYPDDGNVQLPRGGVPPSAIVVLVLGQAAGLTQDAVDELGLRGSVIVLSQGDSAALPTEWYGYQGVDCVVIPTGGEWKAEGLAGLLDDPRRVRALQQWIRMGGRLIVSAAENAARLAEADVFPLETVLPVQIERGRGPREERLAGVREALLSRLAGNTVVQPLIAPVIPVQIRAPAQQRAFGADPLSPAVVWGGRGLGQVTFLCFDTDVGPFTAWPHHRDFWAWLLNLQPAPERGGGTRYYLISQDRELTSLLCHTLEQRDEMKISFTLVAALMFGYLLLVGPLEYFLVRRFLGNPSWSWLTFPLSVTIVCAAAWFSAEKLHGRELHVRKLDVIDFDLTGGLVEEADDDARAMGATYFTLSSPKLERFEVGLAVNLPPGITEPEGLVLGWMTRPADEQRRQAGLDLSSYQAGYRFEAGNARLVGLPMQHSSMKTLSGQWQAKLRKPPVQAALFSAGLQSLAGRVTWNLPWPLERCRLIYVNRVWDLGELAPGRTQVLRPGSDVGLGEYLQTARAEAAARRGDSPLPAALELDDIARRALLHGATPSSAEVETNHYLRNLDQSHRLKSPVAILVGSLPEQDGPFDVVNARGLPGCKLDPLSPRLPGRLKQTTVIRVLLPVSTRPG